MTDSLRSSAPASSMSAADAAALSALLWRERELLENLLFRLTEQKYLIAGGEIRWLAKLDAQVEAATAALQEHEVVRASEVEFVSQRCGFVGDVTLNALASVAEEPWTTLLIEHLEQLRSLMGEIAAATAENRRLLQAGEQATREAIERVIGGASSSTPDWAPGRGQRSTYRAPHMLDTRA